MTESNEPDGVRETDVACAMSRRPHVVLELQSRRSNAHEAGA
jgi:hypothetical protein